MKEIKTKQAGGKPRTFDKSGVVPKTAMKEMWLHTKDKALSETKVDTVALRQADFDRQIFELQEEKRKLYESLVSGWIPLPKYKEQKEQISEKLLEVQNTKAVVMARLESKQEERQHQLQQMDISRMLTESDGLTSELVDLLIDKIYVYPDKRVDVEFKIRDSLASHK